MPSPSLAVSIPRFSVQPHKRDFDTPRIRCDNRRAPVSLHFRGNTPEPDINPYASPQVDCRPEGSLKPSILEKITRYTYRKVFESLKPYALQTICLGINLSAILNTALNHVPPQEWTSVPAGVVKVAERTSNFSKFLLGMFTLGSAANMTALGLKLATHKPEESPKKDDDPLLKK